MCVCVFAGGSEKFQDKQTFFYGEVKKLKNYRLRGEISLSVDRDSILESVSQPTPLVVTRRHTSPH